MPLAIEGWSPALAGELIQYALRHDWALDDLSKIDDPRLWKLLHHAYQADRPKFTTASALTRQVTPAAPTAPKSDHATETRRPQGPEATEDLDDNLPIDEWMRRRNAQVRAKDPGYGLPLLMR